MTRYLITGVTGQIGSYAAEQLVSEGHEVYGLVRGQRNPWVPDGVKVLRGDLSDAVSLRNAVVESDPEVVFNFGAVTAIGQSWNWPLLTADVTGMGVLRLLEACRSWNRDIRVVQASTADQFGAYTGWAADEHTPFAPRSPYGIAKQFAHDTCLAYRKAYGMHVSTAIQFNCTSHRHGDEFVVRKVTKAVAEFTKGRTKALLLGDLSPVRDWSSAEEVAEAYPLIAAQDTPGDYVLASGVAHSLQYLVITAFESAGLNWKDYVVQDPSLMRPVDVARSVGYPRKAWDTLGWTTRVKFEDLIMHMVREDIRRLP